jgi:hypothetical protein
VVLYEIYSVKSRVTNTYVHWLYIARLPWSARSIFLANQNSTCHKNIRYIYFGDFNLYINYERLRVMVFNATFNNISVISWRLVLLVEETGVPGENHRRAASHWQTLSHNVVTGTHRLSGIQPLINSIATIWWCYLNEWERWTAVVILIMLFRNLFLKHILNQSLFKNFSGIIFIRYHHNKRIGKLSNLSIFGSWGANKAMGLKLLWQHISDSYWPSIY